MAEITDEDSTDLFQRLDFKLKNSIKEEFFSDPRDFRSLVEVLNVLDKKADQMGAKGDELLTVLKEGNTAYSELLQQRKVLVDVIEEVVKYQQGGLNNTVEIMTNVVNEYTQGRDEVRGLRQSLAETQQVLTAKKSGQMSMRELWLKKKEAEESLRILRDLEYLKDVAPRIHRLVTHRHYFSAVCNLNHAAELMFGDDLVEVQGLSLVREQLMQMKSDILECLVLELQNTVLGSVEESAEVAFNVHDEATSCSGSQHHKHDYGANQDERSYPVTQSVSFTRPNSKNRDLSNNHDDISTAFESACERSGDVPHGGLDVTSLFDDDAWNLMGVDESAELSLVGDGAFKADLNRSSVFIRLLVRSVGLFKMEEDTERLLLEGAKLRFKEVLRKLKEITLIQKTQSSANSGLGSGVGATFDTESGIGGTGGPFTPAKDRDPARNNTGQVPTTPTFGLHNPNGSNFAIAGTPKAPPTTMMESKGSLQLSQAATSTENMFVIYTGLILRTASDVLKRMLYVLKLLQLMKQLREKEQENHLTNESQDTEYRGVNTLPSNKPKTLEPQPLELVEKSTSEAISSYLGHRNRQALLSLWKEIEGCLVTELLVHFSEQSIQEISDPSQTHMANPSMPSDLSRDNLARSNYDGNVIADSPSNSPQRRGHSLDIGGSARMSSDGLVKGDGVDFEECAPIFSPSYSLAAPIYPLVKAFSDDVWAVLLSEGVVSAPASSEITGKGICDSESMVIGSVDDEKKEDFGLLFKKVSNFLRDEFVPLIQLNTNSILREVQLDATTFYTAAKIEELDELRALLGPAMTTDLSSIGSLTSNRYGSSSSLSNRAIYQSSSGRYSHGHVHSPVEDYLSVAAVKCYSAMRPISSYWVQLPLHAPMLTTVFERVIQGLLSTAKEEVSRLSGPLTTANASYLSQLQMIMKADPAYDHYRRISYVTEGYTLDEIFHAVDPMRERNKPSTMHHSNTSPQKRPQSALSTASTRSLRSVGHVHGANRNRRGGSDLLALLAERNNTDVRGSRSNSGYKKASTSPATGVADGSAKNSRSSVTHTSLWDNMWSRAVGADASKFDSFASEGMRHDNNEENVDILQNFADIRGLCNILYCCGWLSKEATALYASSMLQSFSSTHEMKYGAHAMNLSGKEHLNMFKDAAHGAVSDLTALADKIMAILRGEPQVTCVILLAKLVSEGPIFDERQTRDESIRESVIASQKRQGKSNIGILSNGTVDPEGQRSVSRSEDPPSVASLFAFLHAYKDTLSRELPSSAVQAILAPLHAILPHIMMKSINAQVQRELTTTSRILLSSLEKGKDSKNGSNSFDVELSVSPQLHVRLSKLLVGLHKTLSTVLDAHKHRNQHIYGSLAGLGKGFSTNEGDVRSVGNSFNGEETSPWSISEALSAEFDRVRRFLALLSMPTTELSMYLAEKGNRKQYCKDDLYTLWLRTSILQRVVPDKAPDVFNKVWEDWVKE